MGTKLFVGNLSNTTNEETLKTAFSAKGRVVRGITIPNDRDTGRPRGFAFVEMGSEGEAKAAIAELDGKELDGRALTVNEARERPAGGGGRNR